jgi:hypothetical protein
MNHHTLREIAKFVSGIVAADLIAIASFQFFGLLPITVLGIAVTSATLWPKALFDIALLILLVHYGWGTRIPLRTPRERSLLFIVGVLLFLISLAHLTRIALGWDIAIGGWSVPLWLSWIGVIVALYLSYASLHFALAPKKR